MEQTAQKILVGMLAWSSATPHNGILVTAQDYLSHTCMFSHADIWPSLQQAKRILAGIFSRIAEGFAEPLTVALSYAAKAEPAAPGAFQGQQWPGADAEEPSLLEGPAAQKRQKLGYSTRRRIVTEVGQTVPQVLWQGGMGPATVMPGRPDCISFWLYNTAGYKGCRGLEAKTTSAALTLLPATIVSV